MTVEDNGAAEVAAEQTDTRLSMEDQMGAIYDKMGQEEAKATADEAAVTAEPAEETTGQEETAQATERQRGPDGKFIAKEAKPKEAEAPSEETEQTASAEEGETETAAEPSIQEAPTSWSATAKAEWAKLPPAIQQEVLKREGDMARGLQERATRLKSYEPIEQALEPVRQMLDLNGVSHGQYVRQLVAAEQYLQTKPVEAIQYLAKSYGVDLQGLTQQQAEEVQNTDPAVTALQQELQGLKQQQQQHLQSVASQQVEAMQKQVDAFKAQPGHEHFDAVYDDMVALAAVERQQGRQPTLESLYERSVWANPTVREQVLAKQKAEQEAKAQAEKAKRLNEAKRAAGSNVGTRGASGTSPVHATMEEELAATYDRLNGAA